jgi:RimJ/RimL family protein N-acetyltransferase
MDLRPVTLEGTHVRLEPLGVDHLHGLVEAGREWDLTAERMLEGIEAALRDQAAGTALPFATIDRATGQVAGSTRFRDAALDQRRVEIGSTWLGGPWRRTALNTEAKLLMLEHAFDVLGCERVEFRADADNTTSRRALARIGATEEGTLRRYAVGIGGESRDLVVYSIIAPEWPGVRRHICDLLAAPRG